MVPWRARMPRQADRNARPLSGPEPARDGTGVSGRAAAALAGDDRPEVVAEGVEALEQGAPFCGVAGGGPVELVEAVEEVVAFEVESLALHGAMAGLHATGEQLAGEQTGGDVAAAAGRRWRACQLPGG